MIAMKSFMVLFVLKPAVKIDRKIDGMNFTVDEVDGTKRVYIHRLEEIIVGRVVQTGLVFRVYLASEDIGGAKFKAKGLVDGIVSFMSFATGVGLQIPVEILMYETTPENGEKDFLQVFWNPATIQLSRRMVDPPFLTRVIDNALKQGPSFHRIARAINWYRLSMMSSNIFDKFNCFWIGLEALNPLLQEKFDIIDMPKDVICAECGHKWQITDKSIVGIKSLITVKMNDKALFVKLRTLRRDLLHSTCELGKVNDDTRQLTPKLGEILFRAVCLLLDFPDWNTLEYREAFESIPMRLEVEGKITGEFPSTFGLDGNDPYIEGHFPVTEITEKDNLVYNIKWQSNLTHKFPPSQKFEMKSITLFGDKEQTGMSIETEVKKQADYYDFSI